jgi:hypothetical protein
MKASGEIDMGATRGYEWTENKTTTTYTLFQHWSGDRGDLTIIPPSSRDGKGGVVATQQGMANVRDASVRFDEHTRVCLKGEERNELLVSYVLVPRTRRELL